MTPLEEWAWQFMVQGQLLNALDEILRARGGFDEGKIELDELESEDMDIYLLQKMKSRDIWSEFEQNYGPSLHPTFEDILDYYPRLSSDFSTFEDFSLSISIVFAIVNNYK